MGHSMNEYRHFAESRRLAVCVGLAHPVKFSVNAPCYFIGPRCGYSILDQKRERDDGSNPKGCAGALLW